MACRDISGDIAPTVYFNDFNWIDVLQLGPVVMTRKTLVLGTTILIELPDIQVLS